MECGNKLEFSCPECDSENPPGSKFCNECGTKLTSSKTPDLSPLEDKIDKIQRYLPEGLTDKILSQKDGIEGEKKQVTVKKGSSLLLTLVGNKGQKKT
ncbi:zinc ribbon domain-containing protein [bacterium]|nr:zinc ribbon domain-containing protein [bacterium]